MNILIVDDSRAMRMMIKKTLRDAGYGNHDFDEAGDGAEALAKIRDSNPNMVLCDWNMPNMNGIDLLKTLRAEGNETTFGFITTEGTSDSLAEAKEAGARFVVTKPFTPESMGAALSQVL